MASNNNFLSNLGDTLNQTFDTGNSKNASIDIASRGYTNTISPNDLGSFSSQFDQTANRSYTEEGAQRVDYYNYTPKQLEIMMQDPNITVLVKKRMFASLAENFRPDMMDSHEQLFYKTTKVLFQNKCNQISAYEKLSKIAQVSADIGRVDYHLLPIIFSLTDTITTLPGSLGVNGLQDSINGALSSFKSIVDRVREIYAMSQDNRYTTWIAGIPTNFQTSFGQGTGVMEFTNLTSISTNTTLDFASGTFSLNFSDPYKIMRITNLDIEQAISDSINKLYSNSFLQLGIDSLDQTISMQRQQLNQMRQLRGANPIIFSVNPDDYFGKIVTAIIDNIGFQINFDASSIGNIIGTNNIDPSALFGSDALGNDGMNANEVSLFNNIVSSLYSQVSLAMNTRRQAMADNQDQKKELNLIRKKMRLHYGGKFVIQPMDSVHIYISSKKKIDNKIMGGLQSSFSGLGFTQGLNNLTQDIKDTFAVNENYSLEKSVFVGSDFPNWLWQIMRSQIVSDKDGAHVFAGVVNSPELSYTASSGEYTLSVEGKDNADFFNYGVVNFKPSVDVFNGALYDPMTPFKLDFDSVTGVQDDQLELLDENKQLFNSAFLKDKNGLYAGLATNEDNYLRQDADRLKNNAVRRVFYDPDGMVYRWKEGIATLMFTGDSYPATSASSSAPAQTDDPFAGQDIMNVLSLLVSGEPYNFAIFYKAAVKYDNFKRDGGSNQDPSNSYFRGLKDQLKHRNQIYGNFVPFKQLTMDSASLVKILNNQINATAFDGQLQDLIQQRANFADQLSIFGVTNTTQPSPQTTLIQQKLNLLDQQIQSKINDINSTLNQAGNPPVSLIGNDISFDYDNSNLNANGDQTRLDDNTQRDLRRKLGFLTRRLSWKVRNNEDVNFFIVDDVYDKDYDIQAFKSIFTNPETFKSEYLTVKQKIDNIIGVIRGFEIFVNTQGHIEARNAKYNRIPSSVFYKMLRMKDEFGIQVFPQFIEDLSVNQLEGAYQQIETLEDEIRLFCLALGYVSDADCQSFINNFDKGSLGGVNSISGEVAGFIFVSDSNTGKITNTVSLTILSQPDILVSSINTALNTSNLQQQTNLNVFNTISVASFIQSVLPSNNSNNPTQFQAVSQILNQAGAQTRESMILSRLQGATASTFGLSQISSTQTSTVTSVNILQIANSISQRLSQRQSNIKTAVNALKTLQEGVTLFNGSGGPGNQSLGNALLNPTLNRTRNIPKVFEHMIEDESYDDLGPGSGSRYVIKNRDIISFNLRENRPPRTGVRVQGTLGSQFIQDSDLPPDLNIFQNGNAQTTAEAIDYDLWRMYGFSVSQDVSAPYLLDPETQCRPYAVALLSQSRKEIMEATITIVGNEYQQPGEVVYVEDLDMLFYVHNVHHEFSFGSSFTTTLRLTYGHNVGEYIPTFLDVIGKMLYKNTKEITNLAHKRQGNTFNQEHIATLVGDVTADDTSTDENTFDTLFSDSNRLAFQRILDYGGQVLNTPGATLEIRIYYNSDTQFSDPSTYATNLQSSVYQYIIGGSDLNSNMQPTTSLLTNPPKLSVFKSQISQLQVDSSQNGEFRSPSAEAIYYGRQIVLSSSQNSSDITLAQQDIDTAIYNYIVDCWVVFTNSGQGS